MVINTFFTGFGRTDISINVLAQMRKIILESSRNPLIIDWARDIVSSCDWKDVDCEIASIYEYIRDNSRYVHDPLGLEYIETPLHAYEKITSGQLWHADCDDMSVLSLSLYRAIGYPVKLRAVSYRSSGSLGHVYGIVYVKGDWIPVDLIALNGYPGFEKKPYYRKFDYGV